ncbi:hypothetical protein OG696_02945 [Streptomyces sp. NBC_00656]|uniref:hypothetical protein n=1 Tax=Streptomyces sp. NBC_00656 TaxID=2903668 RepID=UPI0032455B56
MGAETVDGARAVGDQVRATPCEAEVVVRDGKAYIDDDGQEDYLPPAVSGAVAWN